jgi:hypothetical protein
MLIVACYAFTFIFKIEARYIVISYSAPNSCHPYLIPIVYLLLSLFQISRYIVKATLSRHRHSVYLDA